MTVYEPLEIRDFPYEGIYQLLVKEHALIDGKYYRMLNAKRSIDRNTTEYAFTNDDSCDIFFFLKRWGYSESAFPAYANGMVKCNVLLKGESALSELPKSVSDWVILVPDTVKALLESGLAIQGDIGYHLKKVKWAPSFKHGLFAKKVIFKSTAIAEYRTLAFILPRGIFHHRSEEIPTVVAYDEAFVK